MNSKIIILLITLSLILPGIMAEDFIADDYFAVTMSSENNANEVFATIDATSINVENTKYVHGKYIVKLNKISVKNSLEEYGDEVLIDTEGSKKFYYADFSVYKDNFSNKLEFFEYNNSIDCEYGLLKSSNIDFGVANHFCGFYGINDKYVLVIVPIKIDFDNGVVYFSVRIRDDFGSEGLTDFMNKKEFNDYVNSINSSQQTNSQNSVRESNEFSNYFSLESGKQNEIDATSFPFIEQFNYQHGNYVVQIKEIINDLDSKVSFKITNNGGKLFVFGGETYESFEEKSIGKYLHDKKANKSVFQIQPIKIDLDNKKVYYEIKLLKKINSIIGAKYTNWLDKEKFKKLVSKLSAKQSLVDGVDDVTKSIEPTDVLEETIDDGWEPVQPSDGGASLPPSPVVGSPNPSISDGSEEFVEKTIAEDSSSIQPKTANSSQTETTEQVSENSQDCKPKITALYINKKKQNLSAKPTINLSDNVSIYFEMQNNDGSANDCSADYYVTEIWDEDPIPKKGDDDYVSFMHKHRIQVDSAMIRTDSSEFVSTFNLNSKKVNYYNSSGKFVADYFKIAANELGFNLSKKLFLLIEVCPDKLDNGKCNSVFLDTEVVVIKISEGGVQTESNHSAKIFVGGEEISDGGSIKVNVGTHNVIGKCSSDSDDIVGVSFVVSNDSDDLFSKDVRNLSNLKKYVVSNEINFNVAGNYDASLICYFDNGQKSTEINFITTNVVEAQSNLTNNCSGSVLQSLACLDSTLLRDLWDADVLETQEGSLAGKTIVIDPGHGGNDPGASFGKLKEKDVVLGIAKELKKELTEIGATVFLTRDGDIALNNKDRRNFAVEKQADFFVSLHADTIGDGGDCDVSGPTAYVLCNECKDNTFVSLGRSDGVKAGFCKSVNCEVMPSSFDKSVKAAKLFLKLVGNVINSNRDVKVRAFQNFSVLNGLNEDIPGVLIETGYLCNSGDREKLVSNKTQIAQAIVEGFEGYYTT